MNMKKRTKSGVIITVLVCTGIFFVTLDLGADAHGQENSTAIPSEIQTMPSNQTSDIEIIKNITSTQNKVFEKMAESLTKSSIQGAITAMSVFFLGIALVVLGLRMTSRVQNFGKYFNLMVWALTVPVLVIIVVYQIGIVTNNPIMFYASGEPYILISSLMYIPLGIVLFLLISHSRMKQP
jgi:ABC-type Na+ efflux pump permease subunit